MRGFFRDDHGVALLDLLVACALLASLVLGTATVFGLQPARTHAAAVSLEAALAEARSLAAASADASNPAYPTGATVVVESDPLVDGGSRIGVYRSRPVIINGNRPYAPPPDAGFPPQRVLGTISFLGNATPIREPFAIMLSGGGYASVQQLGGPYNATQPTLYTNDPGCPASAARIEIVLGTQSEAHPFGCTGGEFVAN